MHRLTARTTSLRWLDIMSGRLAFPWVIVASLLLHGKGSEVIAAPPLADPLILADGSPVATVEQWETKRRPELLEFFTRKMYGRMPPRPEGMRFEVFDDDPQALSGNATRRQVAIFLTDQPAGPRLDLLIYLPNDAEGPGGTGVSPVPIFLGLNFQGNHAIHADPGIRISTPGLAAPPNDHQPADAERGSESQRWPLEMVLSRGYAVATMYRDNIDPDSPDALSQGVRGLYPELQADGDNFSTIAAWAWGLSRAMDYLETDRDIDKSRVAVWGHSRLGKTALWAGATDSRFAMVISNNSGAGGAKLFRRGQGESIERLNTVFPHWFCNNFKKYSGQDTELPFDQHLVIALSAPRPVYITSAIEDKWADPEGEFQAAKAAEPVYQLYNLAGLPANTWPKVDQPIQGQIGYHVRSGGHDVTDYDWRQWLDFADKHWNRQREG